MSAPMSRRHALTSGAAWLSAAGAALAAATPAAAQQAAARPRGTAPRVGLALGSGSARGFAHIGVLQALEEAGVRAEAVAGTSAGALVGAFYAFGYTPWQMQEVALKVREVDVADLASGSKRGMLAGAALQKLVNDYVRGSPIDKFKLPYAAVACDLGTGELVSLRTGDAGAAVRASCAIPGVFIPAVHNGRELVDGGLVSPLPVKTARQMGADFVIAIDVSVAPQNPQAPGLYELVLHSFEIMGRAITQLEAQTADVVIRPNTAKFASTDFTARRDIIQAGYEAGLKALPEIRLKLAAKSVRG